MREHKLNEHLTANQIKAFIAIWSIYIALIFFEISQNIFLFYYFSQTHKMVLLCLLYYTPFHYNLHYVNMLIFYLL